MTILLMLMSAVFFCFTFLFWKKRFQIKRLYSRLSSNSTALALIKTSTCSSHSSTSKPSVKNLSQDTLKHFPHSMTLRKRILVNLKVMQNQLNELEQLLIIKGLNGAVLNQQPTKKVARYKVFPRTH
ncbi:kita-kyushu lung cancer antigen 1 homolog [Cavia porcellus]|uniref:kita-kyushu lung cancer antigen 1 homolog n=1 Tax=Cavia porcellus TaxID=10141 RepID=UPI002FDFD619